MTSAPLTPLAHIGLALLLAACLLPARAAEGLRAEDKHPRWQARLQLSSLDSNADATRYIGSRMLSANLLGDYYLTGSGLGGVRGGLRATGGVLLGPLSMAQTGAGLALGASSTQLGQHVAVGQRSLSLLSPSPELNEPNSSVSYLGIGYTGHALRSGISFSADLGLFNGSSLTGPRLGRSHALGMEDVLRDMRYKPVLQLGLSYSY